jgi:hypothetical protein
MMPLMDTICNSVINSGQLVTKKFLQDQPEWLPVLSACVVEAARTGTHGFAGAWVLKEVQRTSGVKWFPDLRPLVSAGLLRRVDVSRGGRRAYYVLIDPSGVAEGLQEGHQ